MSILPHDHLPERHQHFYVVKAIEAYTKTVKPPLRVRDIDRKSEYMRVWPEYVVGLQLVEMAFKALIIRSGAKALGEFSGHDLRPLFQQLKSEEQAAYNDALDDFARHVHPASPAISLDDKGNWNIMEGHRYLPLEDGKDWKKTKRNPCPPTEVPDLFRISVWHIREMLFVSHQLLANSPSSSMGKFSERLERRMSVFFWARYRPDGIPVGTFELPDDTEEVKQRKLRELVQRKWESLGATTEAKLLTVSQDPAADNILKTDIELFLNKLSR